MNAKEWQGADEAFRAMTRQEQRAFARRALEKNREKFEAMINRFEEEERRNETIESLLHRRAEAQAHAERELAYVDRRISELHKNNPGKY